MAELRYVDWDGLVYYDGKVKQFINDKLEDCLKVGGSVTFENLPSPSFQNLNYIYKVTDEFTSNDYFEKSGYVYKAGTIVQVSNLNNVYLYTIFNEEDDIDPSDIDFTEVYTRIDEVDNKVTELDNKVTETNKTVTGHTTSINTLTELNASNTASILELDSELDKVNEKFNDYVTNDLLNATTQNLNLAISNKADSDAVINYVDTLNERIDGIQDITTTHTSNINTINTSLGNLDIRITEQDNNITSLTTSITEHEEQLNTLTPEVEKIDGIESNISSIEDSIEGINDEINSLQTSTNTLESKVATLEDSVSDNAEAINSLSDNDNTQDEAIETLTTQVSGLDGEVKTLQTTVTQIDNKVTDTNSKVDTNTSNINQLATRIDTVENKLLNLKESITLNEPTTHQVGGIPVGYVIGTKTIEEIFRYAFYGVPVSEYPTITEPTFNVVLDNTTAFYGNDFTTTGHITFDRGLINPAYGTSGYRVGEVVSYTVEDKVYETNALTYDFTLSIAKEHIIPGANTITAVVTFGQGEQPLDSLGNNYESPYNGTTMEITLTIQGAVMSYSGATSDNTNPASTEIITVHNETTATQTGFFMVTDEDGNVIEQGYQNNIPGGTSETQGQVVLIPENMKLIGIKQFDVLSSKSWVWYNGTTADESLLGSWVRQPDLVSINVDGNVLNYVQYEWDTENGDNTIGTESQWRFVIE